MAKFIKKRINLTQLTELKKILKSAQLNTVCEEALCPNIGECFCSGTATFLIAGKNCTRNCSFCAVKSGPPLPVDPDEPQRVAQVAAKLKLKYVVITSVTRDDLADGGAGHFSETIKQIRILNPQAKIEVLTPDFTGNRESAEIVFKAEPYIFNHNLETVSRLYLQVRPKADYQRSLNLITWAKEKNLFTKSGLMLGMGEEKQEIIEAMSDLKKAGCDVLTLGQYLAPSKQHYPVKEYISDESFEEYKKIALDMGFIKCVSAPYVRSSYMADEVN